MPDLTLDRIAEMVALQLGRASTSPDDDLYGDLGAESMDLMHIAIAIEDRFGVFIPEDALAQVATVRDLYALAVEIHNAAE